MGNRESVSELDAFSRAGGVGANALEEASDFFGV